MKKKCCILFNQPGENALPDELDVLTQVDYIGDNLKRLDYDIVTLGITGNFMAEISRLAEEKPDLVFNLVESINNKGELCYFIPALLNLHSLPYSGNPLEAMFNTTSKAITHEILRNKGISTPGSFLPSQHKLLKAGKQYIIKPVWEDGSMGITGESVFTYDPENGNRFDEYRDTHWIIQEFIDGREFNISVLAGENGPEVMPPAEMVFHNFTNDMPRIVDFRAKWVEESFEYENTIREFPREKLNPVLAGKISKMALDCWHVFGLKGYARVDMRIDKEENPYVIEVNANPCMSPDSGLVAATEEAGIPITEVLRRILTDLNY